MCDDFKKVNLLDAYTLLSSLSLCICGELHYYCVMRIVRECIYMYRCVRTYWLDNGHMCIHVLPLL